METSLYKDFTELEDSYWWFQGRREIVFDMIRRYLPLTVERALDVGCGTGRNMRELAKISKIVAGLEMSSQMVEEARRAVPGAEIILGTFPHVFFKDRFNVVLLLDVLEHFEDDRVTIEHLRDLLVPGGYLVLSIPAFKFLWSSHDTISHHYRRYRKSEIKERLEEAGFKIMRLTYFNTLLFPLVASFRIIKNLFGFGSAQSDFFSLPSSVNYALKKIFGAERFLLRVADLPFGVSLICVAQAKS